VESSSARDDGSLEEFSLRTSVPFFLSSAPLSDGFADKQQLFLGSSSITFFSDFPLKKIVGRLIFVWLFSPPDPFLPDSKFYPGVPLG